MDALDLVEIVKKGEDSHLQFKERIDSVNALAAEICAFSNSDGGKLLVGVSDHGDIIGLTGEQVGILNQLISNACSQKINPPVSVTTENIPYADKIVVVINVPMGRNKYYTANGTDVWVKMGADKRRAGREEIQRLLQESGNLCADEMIVEFSGLADIDLNLFSNFYERRFNESLDALNIPLDKLLTNMKLLMDGKCTLAGLLLFAKKPQEKKPSFIIKAISFAGNDLSGEQYRDSRDITGNIAVLFPAAMSFLKNQLRMLQGEQGFNTTGILEIPEVALEESVINALLHRNYYIASNIRVFIFDDRVEIISPGSLPNTLTVESIKKGIHIERNPIMASIIKDIPGIPYRGAGTGILRILRKCAETNVQVEFVNDKNAEQFKVIFYRKVE